ncbi:uncharacterized protein LOC111021026 isoform X2 [Momordica charantia]|uniref:Uncharacterized protein LOC111021026 isoform X2 n=1 Tax=Momordica charantia TaxID=3673 RepID=A0A6J1DJ80_MOMCH|nr:uncharacterized protein LOC111021026 isoform X2 [Momordica charantia]
MPMMGKSGRKVLRDVSNHKLGRNSSKSVTTANRKESDNRSKVEEQDDALDRLLLVQSDLSALTHQIDELVVKAFELKEMGKQGRKEIESFTHVLSDMLSSLKPWVPRFQKAFSHPTIGSNGDIGQSLACESNALVNDTEDNVIDSPDHAEVQALISPSPLVSWRAGCNIERGRQLFLLTPLPISKSLSSKHVKYSESVNGMTSGIFKGAGAQPCFISCGDPNENLLEGNGIEPSGDKPSGSDLTKVGENLLQGNGIEPSGGKPSGSDFTKVGENLLEGNGIAPGGGESSGSNLTQVGITRQGGFTSPPMLSKNNCSVLVMTPCFKMSPPKSCVLLEPISESSHKDQKRLYKATPFPVGVHDYSSSGSDASDGLALKYPELLGIQQVHKSGIRKKEVEASPDWFMSPPKTCVLLEPSDSHSVENAACDIDPPVTSRVLNSQLKSFVLNGFDDVDGCHETKNNFSHQVGVSLSHVDSTPMWKGCESVLRAGKRAGEETLKRELWMKFEAASANPFRSNQTLRNTSKKGFLDLLDEVSCD